MVEPSQPGDCPTIVSGPDEAFRHHPGDRVSPERGGNLIGVQSHRRLGGGENEVQLRLADRDLETHLVAGVPFAIAEGPVVEPDLPQGGIMPGHSGNVPMEALLAVDRVIGSVEQGNVRAIDAAQLPHRLARGRDG